MIFWRKLSGQDKQYRNAKLNKSTESDQPIVKKNTKYKAAKGGRSIKVESVPEGPRLDLQNAWRLVISLVGA